MKSILIASLLLASAIAAQSAPENVTFTGEASSPISASVAVPAGKAYFWTSGTVPPEINEKAPPDSTERYGDTKTQAVGLLKRIEGMLQEQGLALKDVIYLRVYLTPDAKMGGKQDYKGWFDAYSQFFGTKENPTKPARSTVGVASLVSPGWLIEIEAVAVWP